MVLKDRVALVTGASRGIGRVIAVDLARAGAKVVVNYIQGTEDGAQETARLCRETGAPEPGLKEFDVGNSTAVTAAIKEIAEDNNGHLDILVNNAGIARDMLLLRYKDDDWAATLHVNLTGAFNCCRASARYMTRNRWGRIINMASVVGQAGNAGQVAYSASKAALIGMTKSLARELASRNVLVNAIAPGFIKTDMTALLPPAAIETARSAIPLGELGTAEDISPAVVFLCSEGARYITGQVLGINGGLYM